VQGDDLVFRLSSFFSGYCLLCERTNHGGSSPAYFVDTVFFLYLVWISSLLVPPCVFFGHKFVVTCDNFLYLLDGLVSNIPLWKRQESKRLHNGPHCTPYENGLQSRDKNALFAIKNAFVSLEVASFWIPTPLNRFALLIDCIEHGHRRTAVGINESN
jgi:hypothetical protein